MPAAQTPLRPQGPVDCHAHVFLTSLPTVAGARYRPLTDAPLDAYLAELSANKIAGGVLVQPSFLGTDNSFLLDALARHPDRLRGIAVVDRNISPDEMIRLRTSGVRGLRLNLIGRPLPDFTDDDWQHHLRACSSAGLHIEVQSEGPAWASILLAMRSAGCVVVIDHFGRPTDPDPGRCPGFAAVLSAARDPSVWVKLSAPYRFAARSDDAAAALLASAGPDRLLWGSDWPWTQHPEITSYAALLARVDNWAGGPDVRDAILAANPQRLYWR
jgi:predicted TIM-barrel fold metal-dependent hydrolase